MNILSVVQLVAGLVPTVKGILDAATSNESVVAKIKDVSAPLASVLDEVGAFLFPRVAPGTACRGRRGRRLRPGRDEMAAGLTQCPA